MKNALRSRSLMLLSSPPRSGTEDEAPRSEDVDDAEENLWLATKRAAAGPSLMMGAF